MSNSDGFWGTAVDSELVSEVSLEVTTSPDDVGSDQEAVVASVSSELVNVSPSVDAVGRGKVVGGDVKVAVGVVELATFVTPTLPAEWAGRGFSTLSDAVAVVDAEVLSLDVVNGSPTCPSQPMAANAIPSEGNQ